MPEIRMAIKNLHANSIQEIENVVHTTREKRVRETESGSETYYVTVTRKLGELKIATFREFCAALAANSSLEVLDLSQSKIDKNAHRLYSAMLVEALLARPRPLQRLILSDNYITNLNAPEWIALIAQSGLVALDLSRNKLKASEIESLLQGLTESESLVKLDLSRNKLGNEGVVAVANAIKRNHTIQALDLSWNKFSNDAAKSILDIVSSLNLSQLGLDRMTLNIVRQRKLHRQTSRLVSGDVLEPAEKFRQQLLLISCLYQHANIRDKDSSPGLLTGFPKDILLTIFKILGSYAYPQSSQQMISQSADQISSEVLKADCLFENQFPKHTVYKSNPISLSKVKHKVKYDYVVTRSGRLLLAEQSKKVGQGGHLDLARGRPIRVAGELTFSKNKALKTIDNASGHYLPRGLNAKFAALHAFWKQGYDVRGKYTEKEWKTDNSSNKGGRWVPKP
jgi:Leucine Rich repeat